MKVGATGALINFVGELVCFQPSGTKISFWHSLTPLSMLKNWKKLHITSIEQISKKGLTFSINFEYFCQPRQSIKCSRGFPNFSLIILKEEPKSATGLHRQRAKTQNAHCDAVVKKICKNEGFFIDFITGWEKAILTTPVNSGWST